MSQFEPPGDPGRVSWDDVVRVPNREAYADNLPPEPHLGGAPAWTAQGVYPESSNAVLVLILGLVSVFMFPFVGPVAWIMGNTEVRAIRHQRRPPDNLGLARVGRAMGAFATMMMVLLVLAVLILIGILFSV